MSAKRFRLGLVVGKFAPLHLGHESLIAAAAAQCDEVLLLSWSVPELPRCDPEQRRAWLQRRCPQHRAIVLDPEGLRQRCLQRGMPPRALPRNDAPDAEQQDFLAWLLRDVLQQRPDALFANEAYGPPCAQRLSEALGQPVVAVAPDLQRLAYPVSGTALRQQLSAYRAGRVTHIAAEVAGDWVPRIALLGGESSGKSTLAAALAQATGGALVPEFGREWWEARGGQLGPDDLLHIARTQVAREDEAARGLPPLVVGDTSPLTTLGYSLWQFGRADPELVALAKRRYDAVFLCLGDFPFEQDGTRRDARFRAQQEAWYRAVIGRSATPSLELGGSLRRRVARAQSFLRQQGLRWP
jgi:HTH-type transcriptional repressor of NAD biosynthesis genes